MLLTLPTYASQSMTHFAVPWAACSAECIPQSRGPSLGSFAGAFPRRADAQDPGCRASPRCVWSSDGCAPPWPDVEYSSAPSGELGGSGAIPVWRKLWSDGKMMTEVERIRREKRRCIRTVLYWGVAAVWRLLDGLCVRVMVQAAVAEIKAAEVELFTESFLQFMPRPTFHTVRTAEKNK